MKTAEDALREIAEMILVDPSTATPDNLPGHVAAAIRHSQELLVATAAERDALMTGALQAVPS